MQRKIFYLFCLAIVGACSGCSTVPCEIVIYNNSSNQIKNPKVVFQGYTASAALVQPGGMDVTRAVWSKKLPESATVQWMDKEGKDNSVEITVGRSEEPFLSGRALQIFFQICDGGNVKLSVKTNPLDGWR